MQKAKVTWIKKDSCYSVTRPMMSLIYQSIDAKTRADIDDIHNQAMLLGQQLDDRFTDHGGLKVSCYVIGYTYGVSTDSTFVIVEPDGELVIDMDERTAWFDALGTIGETKASTQSQDYHSNRQH